MNILNNSKPFGGSLKPVFSWNQEGMAFSQAGKENRETLYRKWNKTNSKG